MASEPVVGTRVEGTFVVHGREVQFELDRNGQYSFFVEYTVQDPEDDPACSFLGRVSIVVNTDGVWSFARSYCGVGGDADEYRDAVVEMDTVLLPESETLRRVRILMQNKLEPARMLPTFLQLIEMSETEEYMYNRRYTDGDAYQDGLVYDAFNDAVDFLVTGEATQTRT